MHWSSTAPILLSVALALGAGCVREVPPSSSDAVNEEVRPEAGAAQPAPAPAAVAPEASGAPAPAVTLAPPIEVPASITALVEAEDRAPADRQLDEGRHPAQLLAYYRVEPGMKVAEMMAGGGYTAELLARAVGPTGKVYGVNSTWILERFAEKPWAERLQKPIMANTVRLDREFDDPFPPEVGDLDRVFSVLVYHDFIWMEKDIDAMNAAIFRALKPGGIYAVVDHNAAPGAGVQHVKTLHRIEQQVVREQVERAGFRYVNEAGFLRNPEDTRDWNAAPSASGEKRGTSDRFAMTFVKP